MNAMLPEPTRLGNTDIMIPPMGVGAWSWGDRLFWGYGRGYAFQDVQDVFEISLEAGITFFDTADSYGRGQSERILGELARQVKTHPVIATKFMPYPWRLTRKSLVGALRKSLKRLGLQQVQLYQVHHPLPPVPIETWASALADVVELGLTQAVGVSNYSIAQMRRAQTTLAKRNLLLASNQVEYHLLNRKIEFNGLLDLCKETGVTVLAYSPLAQGVLTGKYSPQNPPPGIRGMRYGSKLLAQLPPLFRVMREIGQAHGGKSLSQVALNWVMCKGAVPIPGAKNATQAQENSGAVGWRLTPDEVAQIDHASQKIQ